VTSTPTGVDVYGDGALLGQTPLAASLPTGSGPLHLELRSAGYELYARDLDSAHDVEVVALLNPSPGGGASSAAPSAGRAPPPTGPQARSATKPPTGAAASPASPPSVAATTPPAPSPSPKPAPARDPFEDRQ